MNNCTCIPSAERSLGALTCPTRFYALWKSFSALSGVVWFCFNILILDIRRVRDIIIPVLGRIAPKRPRLESSSLLGKY